MEPGSDRFHSSWKSLRDFHITTASTTGSIFQNSCRSNQSGWSSQPPLGVVTDVSGPQRNTCPGTLRRPSEPQERSLQVVEKITFCRRRRPCAGSGLQRHGVFLRSVRNHDQGDRRGLGWSLRRPQVRRERERRKRGGLST
jgi:hypothetical protein